MMDFFLFQPKRWLKRIQTQHFKYLPNKHALCFWDSGMRKVSGAKYDRKIVKWKTQLFLFCVERFPDSFTKNKDWCWKCWSFWWDEGGSRLPLQGLCRYVNDSWTAPWCEVADPCWRRIFDEVCIGHAHKYISKFAQLSVVIVTFMTLGVVVWLFCTYALSRFKAYWFAQHTDSLRCVSRIGRFQGVGDRCLLRCMLGWWSICRRCTQHRPKDSEEGRLRKPHMHSGAWMKDGHEECSTVKGLWNEGCSDEWVTGRNRWYCYGSGASLKCWPLASALSCELMYC